MSLKLKRVVKRNLVDYRTFIRKQDITSYARSKYSRSSRSVNRQDATKYLSLINARLNEVFAELDQRVRETAFNILNNDEALFARFQKRDKFDLTFKQKFQMARKRIRALLRKRAFERLAKAKDGLASQELLDYLQEVWEGSSEFLKFVAYVVADAYNFLELEKIDEASQTGKIEIYLSEFHEHNDICNLKVGIYDIADNPEIPPFHPYCVCSIRAV